MNGDDTHAAANKKNPPVCPTKLSTDDDSEVFSSSQKTIIKWTSVRKLYSYILASEYGL